MKRSMVGTYTMEALAVASFCCIVVVFLVAHHDLQVSEYNGSAQRAAKQVTDLVSKYFEQNPEGGLSEEVLGQQGLKPDEGVQVKVPLDNKKADNWQVELWHDSGDRRYTVNQEGLKERPK